MAYIYIFIYDMNVKGGLFVRELAGRRNRKGRVDVG
jgi:hypothetical protein